MKKSIFVVAAIAAFSFASCKKDYKCVCKDSSGAELGTYTVHTTKKKAKTVCEVNNATWSAYNGSCAIE